MEILYSRLLIVTFLFIVPSMLYANVGIPTIALVWPLYWLAFIPVVFIEALVMQRLLKKDSFGRLLFLNTVSNAVSTFIGIPLAYSVIFFIYQADIRFIPNDSVSFNAFHEIWVSLIGLGAGSMWWSSLFAIMLLFILFFFISVLIENWVITKFLCTTYDPVLIKKAVKRANIASYAFLILVPVLVLLGAFIFQIILNKTL